MTNGQEHIEQLLERLLLNLDKINTLMITHHANGDPQHLDEMMVTVYRLSKMIESKLAGIREMKKE